MFNLKNGRATFFDFDLWTSEESDKVENYRFLETGPYDFGENRFARATLDAFSSPVIKIPKNRLSGNYRFSHLAVVMDQL